ncbi:MAG: HPr kinase/phosphorylase, partial [Gemmatimonadota bacterium]
MSGLTVADILERKQERLQLELVRGSDGVGREVQSPDISSPGLVLAGFTERFPRGRLQVLGETEISYLASLDSAMRVESIERYYSFDIPAVFVTKGMKIPSELGEISEARSIP